MNYLICIDLEGCAGVHGAPADVLNNAGDYRFACEQAAREGAAAARALFDNGAERVVVWDNHSCGSNLSYDLFPDACEFLNGTMRIRRFSFLEKVHIDAALFVGYHSRDNTAEAVIAHTYSSMRYQYIKVNGAERGEIELDAYLLGEYGVPVVFVASDDKACAQARAFLPSCRVVETKQALAFNASLFRHPRRVAEAIYEGAAETAKAFAANRADFPVATCAEPLDVEMRFKRLEYAQDAEREGFERFEPYCVRQRFEKLRDFRF